MSSGVSVFGDRNGFVSMSALDALLDELVDLVAERVARRLEARDPHLEGELLSIPEAARVLRCKPQRIYDLRSAGRLPRTVEGGRAVVRRSDLDRLVEE
jgi:Helix-turn-helix domain